MPKQLRGDKLLNSIREGIEYLGKKHEQYVYNGSELSRHIGVSRVTLNRYRSYIDEVLDGLGSERRLSNGTMTLEHLYQRAEKLEARCSRQATQIKQLLRHHLEIYECLASHSVDVSVLVRNILDSELQEIKKCPLCGSDTK